MMRLLILSLNIAIGVISLLAAALHLGVILAMLLDPKVRSTGLIEYLKLNPYEIRICIVFLVESLYLAFHGIGLLKRRKWGIILTFVLPVPIVLGLLVGEMTIPALHNRLILLLYYFFLVVFVTRPKVKATFK